MPEAPECRLTIDYLSKELEGKKIQDWVFCGGGYTDEEPKGFSVFDKALPLEVKSVQCKGKFIYFTLSDQEDNEHYIMHSLMMTGRWQKDYDKCCKWFVELDNGKTIWFRSPRSLSTLSLLLIKQYYRINLIVWVQILCLDPLVYPNSRN